MVAEAGESILEPWEVKKHLDHIGIPVGRSLNANKTTLLQHVCNTTELPKIYNSKGHPRADTHLCAVLPRRTLTQPRLLEVQRVW